MGRFVQCIRVNMSKNGRGGGEQPPPRWRKTFSRDKLICRILRRFDDVNMSNVSSLRSLGRRSIGVGNVRVGGLGVFPVPSSSLLR